MERSKFGMYAGLAVSLLAIVGSTCERENDLKMSGRVESSPDVLCRRDYFYKPVVLGGVTISLACLYYRRDG